MYKYALACVGASAISMAQLDATYTFEQFRAEFSKTYASAKEENYRRGLFEKALKDALVHNADSTQTWKKNINQFSDVTPEEFRNSHGWVPSWGADVKTVEAPPIPANFKLENLPASIDWRQKGVVTPIKNQGMCGSCWAFASTETIESYVALNTSKLMVLSPQNLVSCDPNPKHCGGTGGCGGSIPELAFDYVKANGIATEQAWPYTSGTTSQDGPCKKISPSATLGGFVKLKSNNYTDVMYTLANVGPVAVNVDAIPMQSYGGGLFTGCSDQSTHIDHVVQIVGYGHNADFGKDYWIMRNSWGTTWGDAGFMELERHSADTLCGIDIYPSDGTGCTGGPDTVTVCGSCGLLYDVSYPIGATAL